VGKQPGFYVYSNDVLGDIEYLSTDATTKGVWWQMLLTMDRAHKRGILTGTPEHVARIIGVTVDELEHAIEQFEVHNVCDMSRHNSGEITVKSRRMVAEGKAKLDAAERQRRSRASRQCHTDVTTTSSEESSREVEREREEERDWKKDFNLIWDRYPRKLGKKEASRHFKASVKTEDDLKAIHVALDKFIAQMEKERRAPDKYPYGSTWFNNWRDWLEYEDPKTAEHKTPEAIMEDRPCSICGKRLGDGGGYSNSGYHIACQIRRAEQEG